MYTGMERRAALKQKFQILYNELAEERRLFREAQELLLETNSKCK